MTNPPSKRHPALQPLSRDHYYALVQAKHLRAAAAGDAEARRAALADLIAEWDAQMRAHFDDEERLLVRLLSPTQQQRLADEHTALRGLVSDARKLAEPFADDAEAAWVERLGTLLHDHTRWEERELFPAVEQTASSGDLAALEKETQALEAKRPRAAGGGLPPEPQFED